MADKLIKIPINALIFDGTSFSIYGFFITAAITWQYLIYDAAPFPAHIKLYP